MSLRIDVIRLAGDAGFSIGPAGITSPLAEGEDLSTELTRLVDLAQAAEREACAQLCADLGHDADGYGCAADIRSRSTT